MDSTPAAIRAPALAILAGLIIGSSFPRLNFSWLAWLGPGLLWFAARDRTPRDAFRIGFYGGLAQHLFALNWLLKIPVPVAPVLGWIALCGYLALYQAAWLALLRHLQPAMSTPRSAPGGMWFARQGWMLTGAALWVSLEFLQSRLLGGFPWNLLGSSQFAHLPLVQIASVTGIAGLSFLIVWFSLALFSLADGLARNEAQPMRSAYQLLPPVTAVALVVFLGGRRLESPPSDARTVRLGLIQPSIPQTLIWNEAESAFRFQKLIALSGQALQRDPKPQVLIWPEAALPSLLRYDPDLVQAVTNLAATHRVWMVVGADDATRREGTDAGDTIDYFNSSFLISPEGRLVNAYRKRKLVAFGEFTPFADMLPFLKKILPAGEGFKPGSQPVRFDLPDLGISASVLICFEDTFAALTRADTALGQDFLINLTNNGWFGESAAQWQHAASAAFRAIETGLPLVRCANNGLTCWVDRFGQIHEVHFRESSNIYAAGFKIADLPLPARGQVTPRTFFARCGDLFSGMCLITSVVIFAARGRFAARHRTGVGDGSMP